MGKNITRILGMCMTIFVLVVGCSKGDDSKPAQQQPVVWQQDGQDVVIRNNCRRAVIDPLRSRNSEDECTYLQDESIHSNCNLAERQVLYRQHCVDRTDTDVTLARDRGDGSSRSSDRSHGGVYSQTSNNNPDSIHILNHDEEVAAIHNLDLCAPNGVVPVVVIPPAQQIIIDQTISQSNQSTVYQCNDNSITVNPGNSKEVQLPVKIWTQNGVITQQNIIDACACLVDRQSRENHLNPSAKDRAQQIKYCLDHTVVRANAQPVVTCSQSTSVTSGGTSTGINCQGSQPSAPAPIVAPAPVVAPPAQMTIQPLPPVSDGMCLPMVNYPVQGQDQGPSLFSPCAIETDSAKRTACLDKITNDTKNMVIKINLLKANGTSLQVTRSPLLFLTGGTPSAAYQQSVGSDVTARVGGNFSGAANADVCPLKSINISNSGPGIITINGQDAQMTWTQPDLIQGSYINKNGRISIQVVDNTTIEVKGEFMYTANGETHRTTAIETMKWTMPAAASSSATTGGSHKAHTHKASQSTPDPS